MDTVALLSIIVPIILSLAVVDIVWDATTDETRKGKK
jgi:hypothetical protein